MTYIPSVSACVRDSPNGTIGNFTNGTIGNQRTLNVSRQPMLLVPMLPLVETLVPVVPGTIAKPNGVNSNIMINTSYFYILIFMCIFQYFYYFLIVS